MPAATMRFLPSQECRADAGWMSWSGVETCARQFKQLPEDISLVQDNE